MYSERISQKSIEAIEAKTKIKLIRYDAPKVSEWSAHLDSLVNFKGELARPLKREEHEFIRNERLVSMCDFLYWAPRYCSIVKDGGGVGKLDLWESQRLAMQKIARCEEQMHEDAAKGYPVMGIKAVAHKSRQLGMTMLARGILMHRVTLAQHQRCMSASVDDDKVMELYDRDKFILDNLPWWLKPSVGFDVKAEHLYFDKLNTRILYQQSQQSSGLGQGRQFELSHLTECASWKYPKMISLDFLPTIPQSINTFSFEESTAQGRGNWWHDWTEEVRRGDHPDWIYIFLPFYAEKSKYRMQPPDDWVPAEITQQLAKRVYKTSPEWVGKNITLDRQQLFWYETMRKSAHKSGELPLFLTNYCATPEESFQHTTASPFSAELIERLRMGISQPEVYEFDEKDRIVPCMDGDYDWRDPRGLVLIWQRPKPNEDYVVGVDPTIGKTGWHRALRRADDKETDNAAINVIRVGREGLPDEHVAEYAAPVDALDLAPKVNALGRMYGGRAEDSQALLICEKQGSGVLTQREVMSRFGYTNLFVWKYLDQLSVKRTASYGWEASKENNKALFLKCLRHIDKNLITVHSPYLIEEMTDCTADWIEMSLRAKWGRHDDRVRAFFLAIWAAHDWTNQIDQAAIDVEKNDKAAPWQASDITSDNMYEQWEEKFASLLDS
jgi:hypothetical protein